MLRDVVFVAKVYAVALAGYGAFLIVAQFIYG